MASSGKHALSAIEPAAPDGGSPDRESAAGARSFGPGRALVVLAALALAGTLAYASSFDGVFVFDDDEAILTNPFAHRLWPLWEALKAPVESTLVTRPVPSLTVAVNWALGGDEPWGYHAFNLAVHVLAAAALFGVVRRTLELPGCRERFGRASLSLAFAVALLWLVHPLQTESVTYVIQRVESLMGLFYLTTLYCAIRAMTGARRGLWSVLAVLACLLGMGSKEVMVSAPLLVLAYDAIFVARSPREALRARWGLHGALFATWLLLAGLVFGTGARAESVGYDLEWVAGRDYVLAQPAGVLLYLRLALWPAPLVFYYGWPRPLELADWLPAALAVAVLAAATLFALRRAPRVGFLGLAFAAILAPTTSVVPIVTELYAEHRMYLPLAAVLALVVVGGYGLVAPRLAGRPAARVLGPVLLVLVAGTWGALTHARNLDYHGRLPLWRDTVAKVPDNDRAWNQYGLALVVEARRLDGQGERARAVEVREEALAAFTRAVELRPEYPYWRQSRASCLQELGRTAEAEAGFREVLRLDGGFALAHLALGWIHVTRREWDRAEYHLGSALNADPMDARAHQLLAQVYAGQGKPERAERHRQAAAALGGGR